MRLSSEAFAEGETIPVRHTCDGADVSPPLVWTEAPPQTRSFVLICEDPDAPAGVWHHWAVFDLPADRSGLPEGAGKAGGLRQAVNDFRRLGYGGPCPPRGHGPHRYRFRLLALSVDHLDIDRQPSAVQVDRAARRHLLAEAVLVGTYRRS